MINELEITRINSKYNFKLKIFCNVVYITTNKGEWYIEEIENKFKLHHKNTKRDRNKFHDQHYESYYIPLMFKRIYKHDCAKCKSSKIERLFQQIQENKNRKYICN
jgi:hypothetical protein